MVNTNTPPRTRHYSSLPSLHVTKRHYRRYTPLHVTTRHYRHYTSQHVLHDLLRHYTYYTCYSLYLVWVGGNFLTWCWASKVSRCLRCGCCERRGHTTVPPQLTPQRRTSARRKVAHLRDRAPFQSLNHRWASKELASLVLFIDDRSLARSILIAFSAMKSNPAFILHCMPDESSLIAPRSLHFELI